MNSGLKSLKDRLYYYFAEKNWGVRREYGPYVDAHRDEHEKARWKHWWILIRLNWHYRIKRSTSFLLEQSQTSTGPNIVPYIDGAESEKGNRQSVYHFAISLMKYDVISFDVFDTLILRKLEKPEDVFMLVGEKLGIFGFQQIRQQAEKEARDLQKIINGNREVTILEIYNRVAYYTGINPEKGAELEFTIECDMCMANPYMKQVFEIVKASNKRIFVTSNMYIPQEKMRKLLLSCGYEGFEEILVSCDYHCAKTNGELFEILKQKNQGTMRIIHVGDNKNADIQGASIAKIDSKYYQACGELGKTHRPLGMSPLISSAYKGVINTTLHNGLELYSPLWEYGFIYGGIIAAGFIQWIHDEVIEKHISKILFLSRDGFILKKIYDSYFPGETTEYVYWSRLAALRNVSEGERQPFLTRLFQERCNEKITIQDALNLSGLGSFHFLFQEKGLLTNHILHKGNVNMVINILVDNWTLVENELKLIQDNTKEYLKKIVGNSESIAIVDLGWSGKSIYPLVRILEDLGFSKECIHVFLLGSIAKSQNITALQQGMISCYMFAANYNRDIYDRFCRESAAGLESVEKLFSAYHNSFVSMGANQSFEFTLSEIDNYKAFEQIEDGILAFCEIYRKAFDKYPYIYKISGYDAYIPQRLLFNHNEAYRFYLSELSYNAGIAPSNRFVLNELVGGK